MALYTKAQLEEVIKVAKTAVLIRREKDLKKVNIRGQLFELAIGGYCNRFVRQCFEAGLGIPEFTWKFRAAKAKETFDALWKYRLPADAELQRGDILAWKTGKFGHIVLYIGMFEGKELVAENTTEVRGMPAAPGTKFTSIDDLRPGWTAFRLFPKE